jgi:hypothetical protein
MGFTGGPSIGETTDSQRDKTVERVTNLGWPN